jgi:hypothetical protein
MLLHNLSFQEIENKIIKLPRAIDGSFRNPKNGRDYKTPRWAEMELPSMPLYNRTFDKCVNNIQDIPTQFQFALYWRDTVTDANLWDNWTRFMNGIDLLEFQRGYMCRAMRSYLSFLREYHLYSMLKPLAQEKNLELLHDLSYDISGFDLVFRNDGKEILGIKTFAGTPSAEFMTAFKEKHRHQIKIENVLPLPANRAECKILNGYWVYNNIHYHKIELLLEEIA